MALDAAGAVLIVIGFLAAMVGIGMMYFSADDEQRNDGWLFRDGDRTEENLQRYETGRIISVLGTVTLVAGAILTLARGR